MSAPERDRRRVTFWRSLCFASVALLAGCSIGNLAPAATTGAEATTAPTPRAETKDPSDAEDFLERAIRLHHLITSLNDTPNSSPIRTILEQVRDDATTYNRIAGAPDDLPDGGEPPTPEQRGDAAWMQSGATQAFVSIRQFWGALATPAIKTDAQKVDADIRGDSTGHHLDKIIGDVQAFLHDLEVALARSDKYMGMRDNDGGVLPLQSGVGAFIHYVGPLHKAIHDAMSSVNASLDPSTISELEKKLTMLSLRKKAGPTPPQPVQSACQSDASQCAPLAATDGGHADALARRAADDAAREERRRKEGDARTIRARLLACAAVRGCWDPAPLDDLHASIASDIARLKQLDMELKQLDTDLGELPLDFDDDATAAAALNAADEHIAVERACRADAKCTAAREEKKAEKAFRKNTVNPMCQADQRGDQSTLRALAPAYEKRRHHPWPGWRTECPPPEPL